MTALPSLLPWLLALAACAWAMRATLQRAEARGEAAVAKGRADTAEQALGAATAQARALREQNERLTRAADGALGEATRLRAQLAAEARPGEVLADLQAKFK